MNQPTCKSVSDALKTAILNNQVIGPHEFIDAAQKMNSLLGDEHAKLYDLQQKVAQMKAELIANGDKATTATIKVDASDTYKEFCLQKAYIGRIEEHIRLAKLQSRLASEEAKGYGI